MKVKTGVTAGIVRIIPQEVLDTRPPPPPLPKTPGEK